MLISILFHTNVALFMRAWIEMDWVLLVQMIALVALFMRAWIEISIFGHFAIFYSSPSS